MPFLLVGLDGADSLAQEVPVTGAPGSKRGAVPEIKATTLFVPMLYQLSYRPEGGLAGRDLNPRPSVPCEVCVICAPGTVCGARLRSVGGVSGVISPKEVAGGAVRTRRASSLLSCGTCVLPEIKSMTRFVSALPAELPTVNRRAGLEPATTPLPVEELVICAPGSIERPSCRTNTHPSHPRQRVQMGSCGRTAEIQISIGMPLSLCWSSAFTLSPRVTLSTRFQGSLRRYSDSPSAEA